MAVGSQSAINTVLEKIPGSDFKDIYVGGMLGGISFNSDVVYAAPDKTRAVAVIKVKDEETGKHLPKAALIINSNSFIDTVFTDSKGTYKIKGIEKYDRYYIKVIADDYEFNEFTIEAMDFNDRKKTWEVLLRKQRIEKVMSTSIVKLGYETTIRIGQVSASKVKGEVLNVVDGIIMPGSVDINPDDVEDYSVLQGPEAKALFGELGKNGAIIITTRKAKEIKMKEVVVNSEYGTRRTTRGGICYTNTYKNSLLVDTIATVKTLLSDSIKIYPNPVQPNTAFSVALKLKQSGNCSMQVTDASGRILLLQKFNAGSKDHTERIMSDSHWAGGIYYIRVFDAQNKLVNKSSFIVQ